MKFMRTYYSGEFYFKSNLQLVAWIEMVSPEHRQLILKLIVNVGPTSVIRFRTYILDMELQGRVEQEVYRKVEFRQ